MPSHYLWPATILGSSVILSASFVASAAIWSHSPAGRYTYIRGEPSPWLPAGLYRCDTTNGEISRCKYSTDTKQFSSEIVLSASE